jgi:hypothetical protein
VFAPRGGREKIEEVVPVDGTYEDFPTDEVTRVETLAGMGEGEGALIVRSNDGVTVVLNDAVMNMDTKRDVLGWIFTTVMGSAPESVTRACSDVLEALKPPIAVARAITAA